METYQCVVDTLNIRVGPGTTYAPSGVYLRRDDKINGVKDTAANWIEIFKIFRVSGNELVPPINIRWWCSGSPSYVKLIESTPPPPPPPPPPDPTDVYILLVEDGVITKFIPAP